MRVVIADDSKLYCEVWLSWLKLLGHEVVGVTLSGREAVRLCSELKPDMVMLDISMGDYGGDLASLDIRNQGNAKHILMASSMSSMREEWESKGFGFIVKPVSGPGVLLNKINEMMRK